MSIEKVHAATPSGDSALFDWFERAAKDTAAASVVATWRPPSTEDVSVVSCFFIARPVCRAIEGKGD